METIKNILVPVDGSEISNKALDYASEIGKKFGAEVTVLHVYELPIPITGFEYSAEILANIDEELKKHAQKILDNSANKIEHNGLTVKKLMLVGNQGYLIVDTAEKNKFDLIIMGSRGLGFTKGFLLGSVSNYVIHHTKHSVLLVH